MTDAWARGAKARHLVSPPYGSYVFASSVRRKISCAAGEKARPRISSTTMSPVMPEPARIMAMMMN